MNSTEKITVRKLKNKQDRKHLLKIAKALPQWFNEADYLEMEDDLYDDPGLVAEMEGKRIGFVMYYQPACIPAENRYEITWIAVHPTFRNQKAGKALLQAMEKELLEKEKKEIEIIVWTNLPLEGFEVYQNTLDFYQNNGYQKWFVDEEDAEQWGTPRQFLKKTLRSDGK